MSKGWCTYTVSDKEFYIDDDHPYDFNDGKGPQTWWALRPTFVQVPAPTWAKVKEFIIKVCKQSGKCDKDVASWERKTQAIDKQLGEKAR